MMGTGTKCARSPFPLVAQHDQGFLATPSPTSFICPIYYIVNTTVSLPNIEPARVSASQEEVPCASLAEVPCASACGFDVGARIFPPNVTSNVFPATQGTLAVWEDRDPLVHAAMAWDTLVLSQLHTTKALDAALVKWDCTCMESLDHMTPQLSF
jgi:hypothetical protein